MRSSPKRICGFISPAEASTSPVSRSHRCPATVVEPMSNAIPYARSCRPGPDRGDRRPVVHGDGDRAGSLGRARAAAPAEHAGSASSSSSSHSRASASRSRRRSPAATAELGSGDLDVVEAHDRVDLDRVRVGLLADDLAVELALGRDVDDEVTGDAGRAAEAASLRETTIGRVPRLHLGGRREVEAVETIAVLRVLALGDLDLAAAADAAAAADRVEVDAEPPRRLEHGRAVLEPSSPAGRGEDDECVGRRHDAALRRPSRPPRRPRVTSPPGRVPVPGDPVRAVRVVAHQHVGRLHRLEHLRVERARDRRGEAGRDRHREERRVQGRPVREARSSRSTRRRSCSRRAPRAGVGRSGTPGARRCRSRRSA